MKAASRNSNTVPSGFLTIARIRFSLLLWYFTVVGMLVPPLLPV
jgi:hypothetical protein